MLVAAGDGGREIEGVMKKTWKTPTVNEVRDRQLAPEAGGAPSTMEFTFMGSNTYGPYVNSYRMES